MHVVFAALFLLTGLAARAQDQLQFTEIAEQAGIGTEIYRSAHGHGGGVAWIDFDLDTWPDLFVVNGFGLSPHLYRNNQNGTFTRVDELLPLLPSWEMMGAVFADYDDDGDPDLYIFTDNELLYLHDAEMNPPDGPANLLLRNLFVERGYSSDKSGLGRHEEDALGRHEEDALGRQEDALGRQEDALFQEVALDAGVADLASPALGPYPGYRASSGSFLDYDLDGYVDLYVAHWVIGKPASVGNADRLYRNRGDGTFEDATVTSGLSTISQRASLVASAAHLDDDLYPDLYVGNVANEVGEHQDHLLRNVAGSFVDEASLSLGFGDDASAAMGTAIADFDHDGDWDLYITDVFASPGDSPPLGNVLYLGSSADTFADNSAPGAGVSAATSWGASAFDADLDGLEDLFVATTTIEQDNYLYRNLGSGVFEIAKDTGATGSLNGSGTAVADFDHDGDLDLAISNHGQRLQLMRNDTTTDNRWLILSLEGRLSHGDALGAVVEVQAGALEHRRQLLGGTSAHSQDERIAHFGVGVSETARVKVRWPSGNVDEWMHLPTNRRWLVREGDCSGCEASLPLFEDEFESGNALSWPILVE